MPCCWEPSPANCLFLSIKPVHHLATSGALWATVPGLKMPRIWCLLLLGGWLAVSQSAGGPGAILRMDIGTIDHGKHSATWACLSVCLSVHAARAASSLCHGHEASSTTGCPGALRRAQHPLLPAVPLGPSMGRAQLGPGASVPCLNQVFVPRFCPAASLSLQQELLPCGHCFEHGKLHRPVCDGLVWAPGCLGVTSKSEVLAQCVTVSLNGGCRDCQHSEFPARGAPQLWPCWLQRGHVTSNVLQSGTGAEFPHPWRCLLLGGSVLSPLSCANFPAVSTALNESNVLQKLVEEATKKKSNMKPIKGISR